MKLLSLSICAVLILFCINANAQSFTMKAPGNINVNNGDTITITGTTNDNMLEGHIFLKNNSSTVKAVMVQREILSLVSGTDNAFAFGIIMYAPMVNITPMAWDVNAGITDSTFNTWYFINSMAGTSYVKYIFFDEINPADSAWLIFKFEIAQATSVATLSQTPAFEVYPTPTTNFVNVHISALPQSECSITLTDETGSVIKHLRVVDTETELDLTPLASGKYFITVATENGKKIESFKVVKLN